MKYCW